MKKFILYMMILMSCLTMLCGCWDYKEIDDLAIVAGVAIDRNKDNNKYHLTTEIVDIGGEKGQTTLVSKVVESEGITLYDAIRNAISLLGRKLYWSHAEVLVVSEEIAKEGIDPILDLFNRIQELRLSTNVVVSTESNAKEILLQKGILNEIRSYEIGEMFLNRDQSAKIVDGCLNQFIIDYTSEGISGVFPSIGIVQNDGYKTTVINGTSLFSKDKLVGFLNSEETKAFIFLQNKIKNGILVLYLDPSQLDDYVSFRIFQNQTKIIPQYKNNELLIKVKIRTEVVVGEMGTNEKLMNKEGIKKLESLTEKQLEKEIEDLIMKVQTDYDDDIFGFGQSVKENIPSLWKKIHKDWDTIFKDLKVEVTCEVSIINSALSKDQVEGSD